MPDRDFFARTNEIFVTLFNLANEELIFNGIKIESSVIVDKIISPLKDLYLKNLSELIESYLKKTS
jgi:hypothetical protein